MHEKVQKLQLSFDMAVEWLFRMCDVRASLEDALNSHWGQLKDKAAKNDKTKCYIESISCKSAKSKPFERAILGSTITFKVTHPMEWSTFEMFRVD